MRTSRRGSHTIDEIEAGASISPLGTYGDGISGAPGYYADGVSGIAEPVMTLDGHGAPGRTARRRSFAGQLRRESRQFTRRGQLAGLGGLGNAFEDFDTCSKATQADPNAVPWDALREPGKPNTTLEKNRRYGFDSDPAKCAQAGGCYLPDTGGVSSSCFFKGQGDRHFPSFLDPAYDWAATAFNEAWKEKTGIDPGFRTTPPPSGTTTTVPAPNALITAFRRHQAAVGGKAAVVATKKIPIVPIVAGAAVIGLLIWAL